MESKLQQHRHHDLGLVCGRETNKPAVILTTRVLRSARFAGESEALDRGGARGSTGLEHGLESLEQNRVLLRGQLIQLLSLRNEMGDLRPRDLAPRCERSVEPRHVR